MRLSTKLYLLYHILRWRLTWGKRDTHYAYRVPGNAKFMGSRDAVKLIRDGDVIATSGMAGNQMLSILYYAIRETFEETGHPRSLTLMCTGGQGSRGRVPGSMEELAQEGLNTRLIAGHHETFKGQLRLADQGKLDLQCIPQGLLTFLFEAQGKGEDSLLSRTGIGTFVDPRVGPGSAVVDAEAEALVTVEGDQLRYRAPRIKVGMFSAPAADREGNIYLDGNSMVGETSQVARAARANDGCVIATVSRVIDKQPGRIDVPAKDVDAIVVDPDAEQAASIKHHRSWSLLTTHSDVPLGEAIQRLRFINQTLGITPRRTQVDNVVARLAAVTFAQHARRGGYVNIGVGLPEEVCRILFEAGLLDEVTAFTETGVIGGIPAPGMFFGAAACPEKMIPSCDVFRLIYERLDVAVLGVVEADSEGNVNVSRRGEGPLNYVGPGGFIDITTGARMVLFVAAWMPRAKVRVRGARLAIVEPREPKFKDRVSEITFSGRQALKAGKKVFFATTVGLFELTERGMELRCIMPGIDLRRDVLEPSSMKVVLPPSGDVPTVDASIVTGRGFRLAFNQAPPPREAWEGAHDG